MENPKIILELDMRTQQLTVSGPMHDGTLFLRMLEMAKVVFQEHRAKSMQSPIQVVQPGQLPAGMA